jgi:hypothetical protein
MLAGLCAFWIAIVLGTLVEYWGHRLMHAWFLKRRHALHHQEGTGQGWPSPPTRTSFSTKNRSCAFGSPLGYAAFAAYSHQLQHEKPELCFWIARPVHHLHLLHHMWHHNFDISTDLWDHVFGTYKKVDWNPGHQCRPISSWFRIRWIRRGDRGDERGQRIEGASAGEEVR